jgi:hypothetical protein
MTFTSHVKSAKGLVIPQGVIWLYLSSLTSAEGLVIPQGVIWLYLPSKIKAMMAAR